MTSEDYYKNLLNEALLEIRERNNSAMVVGVLGVGTQAFDGNLKRLKDAIAKLEAQGVSMFDQTRYLDIYRPDAPRDYAKKFEIFYKGLIQSGFIKKLYVVPGFEQAIGVLSEINYAEEKGIEVDYLR